MAHEMLPTFDFDVLVILQRDELPVDDFLKLVSRGDSAQLFEFGHGYLSAMQAIFHRKPV
jgi:hypothetical protein